MTRNTWVPLLILLLLLMQSNWIQAFPNGSQVERVSELGFGFRAVTLAVPVAVDFESVGHFKYLYYGEKRLCQLGECSVSPPGGHIIFQDGASGNLFLYRRRDGRLSPLTKKFVSLVKTFEWHDDTCSVKAYFENGVSESYPVSPL